MGSNHFKQFHYILIIITVLKITPSLILVNTINELSPFVKKLYYRWKNYLNDHEAIKVHLPNLHIFFEKNSIY